MEEALTQAQERHGSAEERIQRLEAQLEEKAAEVSSIRHINIYIYIYCYKNNCVYVYKQIYTLFKDYTPTLHSNFHHSLILVRQNILIILNIL